MKYLETDHWELADFQAFVLLYLARIDGQPVEEEMEAIIDKVGSDTARAMLRQTDKLSDYECLQVIESERKRFYPSEKDVRALNEELKSLLLIDGKLSDFEQSLLHRLASLW